jgi:transcription initiation factor TFIIIB Brf1 subunit/transcription initiation factor TFIIB
MAEGEVVCTQCGLVVDGVVDTGPEWRIYDASQLARIRAAPLRLVGRTEIGVGMERGARWLALASFYRDTLHGKEMRLAAIGAEMSRVRERAGAPHRVAEAAMALVRRHIYELEGLSAGAIAAAALWLATYKEYGMLIRLAEAAGATVGSVENAARRMRA